MIAIYHKQVLHEKNVFLIILSPNNFTQIRYYHKKLPFCGLNLSIFKTHFLT